MGSKLETEKLNAQRRGRKLGSEKFRARQAAPAGASRNHPGGQRSGGPPPAGPGGAGAPGRVSRVSSPRWSARAADSRPRARWLAEGRNIPRVLPGCCPMALAGMAERCSLLKKLVLRERIELSTSPLPRELVSRIVLTVARCAHCNWPRLSGPPKALVWTALMTSVLTRDSPPAFTTAHVSFVSEKSRWYNRRVIS
jgi:hypothetical protein